MGAGDVEDCAELFLEAHGKGCGWDRRADITGCLGSGAPFPMELGWWPEMQMARWLATPQGRWGGSALLRGIDICFGSVESARFLHNGTYHGEVSGHLLRHVPRELEAAPTGWAALPKVPLSRRVHGPLVVGLGTERAQDLPGDGTHCQRALRAHPVAGRHRARRGPKRRRILKNRNLQLPQADETEYVNHFIKGTCLSRCFFQAPCRRYCDRATSLLCLVLRVCPYEGRGHTVFGSDEAVRPSL